MSSIMHRRATLPDPVHCLPLTLYPFLVLRISVVIEIYLYYVKVRSDVVNLFFQLYASNFRHYVL